MTLADLLKLANSIVALRGTVGDAIELAAAILSLLTAETCGWERPFVGVRNNAPFIVPPDSWAADVSPADARVLAVMLLVAADSAEENQ